VTQLFERRAEINVGGLLVSDLRVAFKVEKTARRTPNKCEVRIWNLNPDHRRQLEQLATTRRAVPVQINAGYREALSTVYLGELRTARTERDGPNLITTLAGGDGERASGARVSRAFGPGTPLDTVLGYVADALGVGRGNSVEAFSRALLGGGVREFAHGTVVHGRAVDELDGLARSAGLEWSIQDGALQVLPLGAPLNTTAVVLSASSGLVGVPTVDARGVLKARALLLPDLVPGRLVEVEGEILRGRYRIDKANLSGDTGGKDWHVAIEGRAP
jgi:hypothetical protein